MAYITPLASPPTYQLPVEQNKTNWIEATNELIASPELTCHTFTERLPKLSRQLTELHQQANWLQLWGQSHNHDELVDAEIVNAKILEVIAKLSGCKQPTTDNNVFHAGLLHTYGYLLSNLQTSFGYKRKRWTTPTISEGLDLPKNVWGPYPADGNFLANVTFIAANIAFHDECWTDRIESMGLVSPKLRTYDFSNLSISRIQETLTIEEVDKNFEVTLYTDLVSFKYEPTNSDNRCLLVYSLKDGRRPHPVLITMFPVGDSMVEHLLSQQKGRTSDIQLQYNAYVPNVPRSALQGKREMQLFDLNN